MKELKDLNDLLGHEIQVLYSGERLLVAGIKRMIEKANNLELKVAFQLHLEETETHISRLEQAAKMMNIDPEGDGNPSMKGLLAESEKAMHKDSTPETMDATLIAAAQKIEHYEIAGYGTAAVYAEELGYYSMAKMLKETLDEEIATDTRLNNLAIGKINRQAMQRAD